MKPRRGVTGSPHWIALNQSRRHPPPRIPLGSPLWIKPFEASQQIVLTEIKTGSEASEYEESAGSESEG
jgi:hypothetical protein